MKLSCCPLAFTLHKAFLKEKKRSGTSLPYSFSAWFLKENISLVMFYQLKKFHCLVILTSWDIGQYVDSNCMLTRLWRHRFWNYAYPSNQAVFPTWPKCQDKSLNILRTKRAFKMKQNVIFIIFKGLSLEQIKKFFLEGESSTLSIFISFLHGFLCVKSLCMKMANDDHQIVLQFLLMHHGSLENEDSTTEFFSKFVKSLVSLSSQTFLRIFYSAII